MHGISSQYVDGLEIRIKELEAENGRLNQMKLSVICDSTQNVFTGKGEEIDRLKARIAELEKPGDCGELGRVMHEDPWQPYPFLPGSPLYNSAVARCHEDHIETINQLALAHSADLRVAEEKNREKVRELVSELEYLLSSQPWPDEKRARKCIAKYKEGK